MPLGRLVPAFVLLGLILCPQVSTLTLTYTSTPSMALQAGSDWWHGTITIKKDGSVNPADAPIIVEGNIYTLTKNVKSDGNGIIILRDNIVVDGAGHTIEGSNTMFSNDVYLFTRTNITIKNLNIQNFHFGIGLDYSSYNTIANNNVGNNGVGIYLRYSLHNLIYNNVFVNDVNVVVEGGVNYWSIEKTRGTNIMGGSYIGGNYWSGFSDTCTDSDGDLI